MPTSHPLRKLRLLVDTVLATMAREFEAAYAKTARELANVLELPSVKALQPWIKWLLEWELIQSAGRTQATYYFVDPRLLRPIGNSRAIENGRYTSADQANQSLISINTGSTWSIAAQQNPLHSRTYA